MNEQSLIIIGIFVSYFVLHSLTASLWLKRLVARHLPALTPYYRLLFNLLATVLALPLVYVAWKYPGEQLWQWHGVGFYLANGLALISLIVLLYSLRIYDMGEFMGLRQARGHVQQINDMEHFQLSPLHRYVRHPWYFLILVILWTRDMATNQLLIYSLVTLYLYIGSRLEEQKLLVYHGDVYAAYRKRVAGLIPLPWKTLTAREAEELLGSYRQQRHKEHHTP